jgi:large repetitive protein
MKGFGERLAHTAGLVGAVLACAAAAAPASAWATANCATTCTWNGAGDSTAPNWSNSSNWSPPAPTSNTSVSELDFPPLASCDSATNACYSSFDDLSGITTNELVIDGGSPYTINGSGSPLSIGSGGIDASTTSSTPTGTPNVAIPLSITSPQTWTISGPSNAELDLNSNVTGGGENVTVDLDNGTLGLGTQTSVNDQLGTVDIDGSGALDLGNGGLTQLNSESESVLALDGTTLSVQGVAEVGPVTGTTADVNVGSSTNAGLLNTSGSTTLDANSELGLYLTDSSSTPTPGSDFSQLNTGGTLTLGSGATGPALVLTDQYSDTTCRPLAVGTSYTLAQASMISGTFSNAAPDSEIEAGCNPNTGTPATLQLNNYSAPGSSTITATVLTPGSVDTTTSLGSNPQSPVTNQSVQLTANVSQSGGPNIPTGTVDFTDGGSQISGCTAQPLDGAGDATCQTSLPAGSANLTAIYSPSGGSNFSGSSGSDDASVGKDATSTALSASSTSPSAGLSVTYTAIVTPAHPGQYEPSGSVEFLDGGSPISGCASQPLTAGSSSSTASCSVIYGSGGSHSITASYGGDGNFTGSASSPQTVTVSGGAGPALAAITKAASAIGARTATLNGVINTTGSSITWQFQFGTSTSYSNGTPVQTLTSAAGQSVPVSWKVTDLQPNTTYHVRLIAKTSTVTASGADVTFTTANTGKIKLAVSSLKLTGGFVFVPLGCSSKLACDGRFSITTEAKVGKHHKLGTVVCNTTFFKLRAGKTKKIRTGIYGACITLLSHARGHRIRAQFTSRPRTGQLGIIKNITLFP